MVLIKYLQCCWASHNQICPSNLHSPENEHLQTPPIRCLHCINQVSRPVWKILIPSTYSPGPPFKVVLALIRHVGQVPYHWATFPEFPTLLNFCSGFDTVLISCPGWAWTPKPARLCVLSRVTQITSLYHQVQLKMFDGDFFFFLTFSLLLSLVKRYLGEWAADPGVLVCWLLTTIFTYSWRSTIPVQVLMFFGKVPPL